MEIRDGRAARTLLERSSTFWIAVSQMDALARQRTKVTGIHGHRRTASRWGERRRSPLLTTSPSTDRRGRFRHRWPRHAHAIEQHRRCRDAGHDADRACRDRKARRDADVARDRALVSPASKGG